MRYAQINEQGICFAVSVLRDYIEDPNLIILDEFEESPFGKRRVANSWVPVDVPEPEQEDTKTWKITKLAFKNRFPRAKWIAAKGAAQSDPILGDFFETFELSTWIDLQRQDTIESVQFLTQASIPESFRLTAEEYSEVIEVPARPEEIPIFYQEV